MIDPLFLNVDELADRWKATPRQILERGLLLKLPLWFFFDGHIFDHPWHGKPEDFFGHMRAMAATISRLMDSGETDFPIWAYHPSAPVKLLVVRPGQAVGDGRIMRLAPGREGYWKDRLIVSDLLIPMEAIRATEDQQPREKQAEDQASLKPIPRLRSQEITILTALAKLGYDPKALPKQVVGRNWIPSELWELLKNNKEVFVSDVVFNKAWARLKRNRDIIVVD